MPQYAMAIRGFRWRGSPFFRRKSCTRSSALNSERALQGSDMLQRVVLASHAAHRERNPPLPPPTRGRLLAPVAWQLQNLRESVRLPCEIYIPRLQLTISAVQFTMNKQQAHQMNFHVGGRVRGK